MEATTTKTCHCGNEFQPRYRIQRTCSRQCAIDAPIRRRKRINCRHCGHSMLSSAKPYCGDWCEIEHGKAKAKARVQAQANKRQEKPRLPMPPPPPELPPLREVPGFVPKKATKQNRKQKPKTKRTLKRKAKPMTVDDLVRLYGAPIGKTDIRVVGDGATLIKVARHPTGHPKRFNWRIVRSDGRNVRKLVPDPKGKDVRRLKQHKLERGRTYTVFRDDAEKLIETGQAVIVKGVAK